MSRTNEASFIKCMKVVIVNVDYREVFVIINNIGIKINANVNVKIWLTKEYVIKDLSGMLAIVNMINQCDKSCECD